MRIQPGRQAFTATKQTPALVKEHSEIGLDLPGEDFAKESWFSQKREAKLPHRKPVVYVHAAPAT